MSDLKAGVLACSQLFFISFLCDFGEVEVFVLGSAIVEIRLSLVGNGRFFGKINVIWLRWMN